LLSLDVPAVSVRNESVSRPSAANRVERQFFDLANANVRPQMEVICPVEQTFNV
jgi:hypothetical protein